VSDSLETVARRLGVATPAALSAVFSRWEELMGPAVAAHARPVSLSAGTLVIGVEQPAWATQLRFLVPEVLARLEATAGPGLVERIEIRVLRPGAR